jgi:hypothetical protein
MFHTFLAPAPPLLVLLAGDWLVLFFVNHLEHPKVTH